MKLRPEAVEKITVRLDMEITRAVKNWRHFARELNVAPEVIESLKWYGTFSPTANVYDNLEFTKTRPYNFDVEGGFHKYRKERFETTSGSRYCVKTVLLLSSANTLVTH